MKYAFYTLRSDKHCHVLIKVTRQVESSHTVIHISVSIKFTGILVLPKGTNSKRKESKDKSQLSQKNYLDRSQPIIKI